MFKTVLFFSLLLVLAPHSHSQTHMNIWDVAILNYQKHQNDCYITILTDSIPSHETPQKSLWILNENNIKTKVVLDTIIRKQKQNQHSHVRIRYKAETPFTKAKAVFTDSSYISWNKIFYKKDLSIIELEKAIAEIQKSSQYNDYTKLIKDTSTVYYKDNITYYKTQKVGFVIFKYWLSYGNDIQKSEHVSLMKINDDFVLMENPICNEPLFDLDEDGIPECIGGFENKITATTTLETTKHGKTEIIRELYTNEEGYENSFYHTEMGLFTNK